MGEKSFMDYFDELTDNQNMKFVSITKEILKESHNVAMEDLLPFMLSERQVQLLLDPTDIDLQLISMLCNFFEIPVFNQKTLYVLGKTEHLKIVYDRLAFLFNFEDEVRSNKVTLDFSKKIIDVVFTEKQEDLPAYPKAVIVTDLINPVIYNFKRPNKAAFLIFAYETSIHTAVQAFSVLMEYFDKIGCDFFPWMMHKHKKTPKGEQLKEFCALSGLYELIAQTVEKEDFKWLSKIWTS